MMRDHLNMMRREAGNQSAERAGTRLGTISGYDASNFLAKVLLQPDNVETGWLPIGSAGVGQAWGVQVGPSIGDMVAVEFQDGGIDAGLITQRFFNDQARPGAVLSGEIWLVHASGSLLKFHADGSVELTAAGALTSSAPQWNHAGPVHITGNVLITGTETVTGLVSGQGGMAITGGTGNTVSGNLAITAGNVTADGISLKTHTHTDPQGGTVGAPQ